MVDRVSEYPSEEGYWVAPTVVRGAPIDSAVVTSELFGPVLSVEPVASLEAACELVEQQGQALTGGLFIRNPRTVSAVMARTPVATST